MKETLWERIKWWLYHPRFELIYLLGGIPRQHLQTTHYRNIKNIVEDIQRKIKEVTR